MNSRLIKSLQEKKYREKSGLFIVQGEKACLELFESDFEIDQLFCTPEFAQQRKKQISGMRYIVIESAELQSLGTFQANTSVLAVVKQKPFSFNSEEVLNSLKEGPKGSIILVLDGISDPGNLGTIIRVADWYGIDTIVASTNTTDVYNPKTISATMGSFLRVTVHYTSLETFLRSAQEKNISIMGATLQGVDVHKIIPAPQTLVVIGNESHGMSFAMTRFLSEKITIPRYGKAESLNAGIATAVILDVLKSK